jgi:16S rRNA (cytosine967-C5)-methyltransferase
MPAGLALRLDVIKRLEKVLEGGPFEPLAADAMEEGRDRALANRLLNTVLRRKGHLDLIIAELLEKGLPKKSGSFEATLRLSLAQLLFLPDLGAHSALFLGVEAIKRDPRARHLTGLMNAVLRRAQGSAPRYWDLPLPLLFPDALRTGWSARFGEAALERFGTALLEGAALDLTVKDPNPELLETLNAEPFLADTVRVRDRDRPVSALPGFREGQWWVQDAATAVPARLMRLGQGARVLDLCAAPGGKTAQLVKYGLSVTALDIEPQRLERLTANLDRLGYAAETVVADGVSFLAETPFDGVLLDAPCSATGIFRRHPEVIWRADGTGKAGRVALQRRLLANGAKNLKPGGVLIYCVCSLEAEEGEEQVEWVRNALPELMPDPISESEVEGLAEALQPGGTLRLHPALSIGPMDGFFVARFRSTEKTS